MVRRLDLTRTLPETLRGLQRAATASLTRPAGTIVARGDDGTRTVIGADGVAQWVGDTTPPPVPSAPSVTAGLGSVTVTWDGLWAGPGEVTPSDFSHVEVLVDGATQGRLAGPGEAAVVAGLGLDVVVAVALVSVDSARDQRGFPAPNRSLPSATVTARTLEGVDAAEVGRVLTAVRGEIEETGRELDQRFAEAMTAAGDALFAANGKNRIQRSLFEPSGVGGQVGDLWWQYADDTFRVVIGQWVWSGAAWTQMALGHPAIASVDVGSLTVAGQAVLAQAVVDALWVQVVRARKITTDMLLVGGGLNLVEDSSLQDPSKWNVPAGSTWGSPGTVTIPNSSGARGISPRNRFYLDTSTRVRVRIGVVPSVATPANRLKVVTWTGPATPPPSGNPTIELGNEQTDVTHAAIAANATGYLEGVITLQPGRTSVELTIPAAQNGTLRVISYEVVEDIPSLIVDGGITARHILASSVTADKIAANAITTVKIAAEAITAGKIAADAVTASKIAADAITTRALAANSVTASVLSGTAVDGKTVTGATIQSSATWNRGVKVNDNGILAYNANGDRMFWLDSATGFTEMVGGFRTANDGPRLRAYNGEWGGYIRFYTDPVGAANYDLNWAHIYAQRGSQSSSGQREMRMALAGYNQGFNHGSVGITEDGADIAANRPASNFHNARMRVRQNSSWDISTWNNNGLALTNTYVNADGSWNFGGTGNGRITYEANSGNSGYGSVVIRKDGGHFIHLDANGWTYLRGNANVSGAFTVNGSKNFVMDHPVKKGWSLKHASTESPHNGVEYWSDEPAVVGPDGTVTVELPDYFGPLTSIVGRAVFLTPHGPDGGLWSEEVESAGFVVHGTPGTRFSWLVKARRVQFDSRGRDRLAFEVEYQGTPTPTPSSITEPPPPPAAPAKEVPAMGGEFAGPQRPRNEEQETP
ncbi:hypothetical protein [Litorihabitans aurantiacus]|uniref:Minor tail protein n=1 Tax=Litorihabitans aurantiacus TaxID=1930061 RepID=A0AA38CWP0_9MICO|nr:hypothetical protein [Litorihabitans aurantiacus]GMA33500.1 hypothetical protein GCM10025875_34920 [Litorihabitans aurantiacus]GMA33595.1 hypothetical protein GCM10025875_35870 [Litorihabitans aurantiacus]